jgi:hypothetical protein
MIRRASSSWGRGRRTHEPVAWSRRRRRHWCTATRLVRDGMRRWCIICVPSCSWRPNNAPLGIVRQQNARSFELRSATSLARLWRGQHRRREAYDVIALICPRVRNVPWRGSRKKQPPTDPADISERAHRFEEPCPPKAKVTRSNRVGCTSKLNELDRLAHAALLDR